MALERIVERQQPECVVARQVRLLAELRLDRRKAVAIDHAEQLQLDERAEGRDAEVRGQAHRLVERRLPGATGQHGAGAGIRGQQLAGKGVGGALVRIGLALDGVVRTGRRSHGDFGCGEHDVGGGQLRLRRRRPELRGRRRRGVDARRGAVAEDVVAELVGEREALPGDGMIAGDHDERARRRWQVEPGDAVRKRHDHDVEPEVALGDLKHAGQRLLVAQAELPAHRAGRDQAGVDLRAVR